LSGAAKAALVKPRSAASAPALSRKRLPTLLLARIVWAVRMLFSAVLMLTRENPSRPSMNAATMRRSVLRMPREDFRALRGPSARRIAPDVWRVVVIIDIGIPPSIQDLWTKNHICGFSNRGGAAPRCGSKASGGSTRPWPPAGHRLRRWRSCRKSVQRRISAGRSLRHRHVLAFTRTEMLGQFFHVRLPVCGMAMLCRKTLLDD
jgi:hypothetical protein